MGKDPPTRLEDLAQPGDRADGTHSDPDTLLTCAEGADSTGREAHICHGGLRNSHYLLNPPCPPRGRGGNSLEEGERDSFVSKRGGRPEFQQDLIPDPALAARLTAKEGLAAGTQKDKSTSKTSPPTPKSCSKVPALPQHAVEP